MDQEAVPVCLSDNAPPVFREYAIGTVANHPWLQYTPLNTAARQTGATCHSKSTLSIYSSDLWGGPQVPDMTIQPPKMYKSCTNQFLLRVTVQSNTLHQQVKLLLKGPIMHPEKLNVSYHHIPFIHKVLFWHLKSSFRATHVKHSLVRHSN